MIEMGWENHTDLHDLIQKGWQGQEKEHILHPKLDYYIRRSQYNHYFYTSRVKKCFF